MDDDQMAELQYKFARIRLRLARVEIGVYLMLVVVVVGWGVGLLLSDGGAWIGLGQLGALFLGSLWLALRRGIDDRAMSVVGRARSAPPGMATRLGRALGTMPPWE